MRQRNDLCCQVHRSGADGRQTCAKVQADIGAAASAATGFELLSNQLSNWLSTDDYNIVLTYPANDRRTLDDAKAAMRDFFKLYRPYCREHGYKPDYVYNTEVGARGAIHHHIILHSHRDIEIIEDLWAQASGGKVQHGGNWRLWHNYDWYGLARYYVDRTKGGKLPDTHIHGERRYIPSKGLKKPKITVERVDAERWYKPRAPKGYELISDSIYSGTDELTGGSYIKYAMRRII